MESIHIYIHIHICILGKYSYLNIQNLVCTVWVNVFLESKAFTALSLNVFDLDATKSLLPFMCTKVHGLSYIQLRSRDSKSYSYVEKKWKKMRRSHDGGSWWTGVKQGVRLWGSSLMKTIMTTKQDQAKVITCHNHHHHHRCRHHHYHHL